MRRQLLVVVAVALVIIVVVGILGTREPYTTGGTAEFSPEQISPPVHALSHLKSATLHLVRLATQLSNQPNLIDIDLNGSESENQVTLEEFDTAFATLREEVGQYESLKEVDEVTKRSLTKAAEDLLDNAAGWREELLKDGAGDDAQKLAVLQEDERDFLGLIDEATTVETVRIMRESKQAMENAQHTQLANTAATTVVILLSVGLGGFVLRQRTVAQKEKLNLHVANEDLEKEVAERSEQLEASKEQLALQLRQRSRIEKDYEHGNRKIKGLLEVSHKLADNCPLEKQMEAVVEGVLTALPRANAASLWLFDGTREQLEVRAWAGCNEVNIDDLGAMINQGTSRTAQERVPPSTSSDIVISAVDIEGQQGVENPSHIVVPLSGGGQVIGALCATSLCKSQAFQADDVQLLQSLGEQASLAVNYAQLLIEEMRHRQQLRRLSSQLMSVRELECKRISRQLHDVMGQAMTAVSINLAKMKQDLPEGANEKFRKRIAESESLTLQTLAAMRELSQELHPSILDDLGLLPTLRWYIRQFGRRLNIGASFKTQGLRERLPPEIETILYRVVQEGLTNVARHAQAQSVCVDIRHDHRSLTLTIADDGKGFDVCEEESIMWTQPKMGLIGMRERLTSIGGNLKVESAIGGGTTLIATIYRLQADRPEEDESVNND